MKYDWLDFHIMQTTAGAGARYTDTMRTVALRLQVISFNLAHVARLRDMWQRSVGIS